MKKLIAIALVLAVLTGFAVYYYFSNLEKSFTVETIPVVVATQPIPRFTAVTQNMLTIKHLPVEAAHPSAARDEQSVVGRVTKEYIEAGEQVLSTKLGNKDGKDKFLSYNLKPGYRAVTFEANESFGVGGYLKEGDRVDIVSVLVNYQDPDKKMHARVVAENLQILELGLNAEFGGGDQKNASMYTSVTLAIPAVKMTEVSYAASEGKCHLALRPITDEAVLGAGPYIP